MKQLYVSTPVNTFHKNDQWQFLVFNYNDAVTQQINTCTQQYTFLLIIITLIELVSL